MKRLLIICISLLLTGCVVMLSWLLIYHHSYSYKYSELDFEEFELENGTLTFHVKSELKGEYVYRVLTVSDGTDLKLTLRGGKQASLAQTPGSSSATFSIELPEGTERVVCGTSTVYNVH